MGRSCNRTNQTEAGNTGNKETLVTTLNKDVKSVPISGQFYLISHFTLPGTFY
jgi:hypothetical protein